MRTDVHSPTHLITEDYEYLFSEVNYIEGAPGWVARNGDYGMELARRIAATDKLDRSTHQCHHCGAHLNYFAVLEHKPTGDLIVVGETCLGNRFERATADFHKMRKQAQLDRERQRIVKAREQFVSDNPDLAWLNGSEDDVPEAIRWSEFVYDLRDKFRRYGELSERQVDALRRTVEKSNRPKAPEPTWVEVPAEGRQVVEGVVLMTKWVESDYGSTLKMLLKVDEAEGSWKLWVTVPRSMTVDKGDTVKVKATIERSHDDASFAFGKRPVAA